MNDTFAISIANPNVGIPSATMCMAHNEVELRHHDKTLHEYPSRFAWAITSRDSQLCSPKYAARSSVQTACV